MSQKDFEHLEQYDFVDGEYLEKAKDNHVSLIGLFLMKWKMWSAMLCKKHATMIRASKSPKAVALVAHATAQRTLPL